MKNNSQFIVIERLVVNSWLLHILPHLIHRGLKKRREKYKIYFFDGTRAGIFLAKLSSRIINATVEKLQFRLADVKDNSGNLLSLRIAYFDFATVQRNILENRVFQDILQDATVKNRMPTFLAKQTASFVRQSKLTLWRALLLVHIVHWKIKGDTRGDSQPILFMDRRLWMNEIKGYASEYNVSVVSVRNMRINFRSFLLWFLGPRIRILKNIYFCFLERDFRLAFSWFTRGKHCLSSSAPDAKAGTLRLRTDTSPKLGVEYYGHLNLEHPEMHSDLFFWQKSSLARKDILIIFNMPRDPVDERKWAEIKKYGMNIIALSPKAKTISSVPSFYHWPKRLQVPIPKFKSRDRYNIRERKWLLEQVRAYHREYDYWADFFARYNIKVFISWFRHIASHCAIADALQSLEGVTAVYQRSFEEFSSPETTIAVDVVFGFSKKGADLEKNSHSTIPYYVITGYFGDHRFPLLKKQAQEVRYTLQRNGAKRIVAFFDENSGDDSRWHTGHEFMRVNYEFLLKKVLNEPWLGVVLKPKVSSTLRRRLGPIAGLLERAEQTGRCFIFEGGALHSPYPPAIAALASDIAVHGHLFAATAGMESVLAGTPTLLLDREGWSISSLYDKLGKGKGVFTDWQDLWSACKEHWKIPSGISGFGDWSAMIDEIDPFRDGRAAERIGTYLKWLLDGFKAKLPRETILADAAQRYSKMWGRDKIVAVR